jgi:ADP-heptose:LPS heptosyltransferase
MHTEDLHIVDAAGETTLSCSTGLIDACDVFVSTDSGPYHMSVALRKPTLVWFTYPEVTSFHKEAWCLRLIQPSVDEFVSAVSTLLAYDKTAD